jgi:integrase
MAAVVAFYEFMAEEGIGPALVPAPHRPQADWRGTALQGHAVPPVVQAYPADASVPATQVKQRLGNRIPAGFTPHWLRHTHATALLMSGAPLPLVQQRMGHADVQTTINTYGWVTEDAALRALAGWQSFAGGWNAAPATS